jgi:hypothetical protein
VIRPEAKSWLLRHREALVGAGLALLGLWWLFGPGGLLTLPAVALVVAGAALVWLGLQRSRFRGSGEGPGAVDVTEGQIAYFGPETGGVVFLRELSRISLDKRVAPAVWQLEQSGQAPLAIPADAAGADALFDAFASLPGFQTARMLAALKDGRPCRATIWQRNSASRAQLPLH